MLNPLKKQSDQQRAKDYILMKLKGVTLHYYEEEDQSTFVKFVYNTPLLLILETDQGVYFEDINGWFKLGDDSYNAMSNVDDYYKGDDYPFHMWFILSQQPDGKAFEDETDFYRAKTNMNNVTDLDSFLNIPANLEQVKAWMKYDGVIKTQIKPEELEEEEEEEEEETYSDEDSYVPEDLQPVENPLQYFQRLGGKLSGMVKRGLKSMTDFYSQPVEKQLLDKSRSETFFPKLYFSYTTFYENLGVYVPNNYVIDIYHSDLITRDFPELRDRYILIQPTRQSDIVELLELIPVIGFFVKLNAESLRVLYPLQDNAAFERALAFKPILSKDKEFAALNNLNRRMANPFDPFRWQFILVRFIASWRDVEYVRKIHMREFTGVM